MKKLILLLLVLGCLLPFLVNAQSCTQTLRTARATYDQGRLHELPTILEGCLKGGFTDQEKVEAYKLLTLSYIYLEEPAKADEAMLNLLRTDHYFEINKATDPAEFIALYQTFRTKPIFRIGISLGVNATQPNVVSSIKTNDGTAKYHYQIAFQAGLNGEIPLLKKFTLNPSLLYQLKSFDMKSSVPRGIGAAGSAINNSSKGKEVQSWISLPIAVQYQIKSGRYNPYISAGIATDYLLASAVTLETVQDEAGIVQETSLDLKPQREKLNFSAILGAGAKLRLFGGYVGADVRFLYGLKKINSEKTAYNNQSLAFDYNWGDSIFKLNSMVVTIGYVQNIFNPKKLSRRK